MNGAVEIPAIVFKIVTHGVRRRDFLPFERGISQIKFARVEARLHLARN
jgi:hypothetical protein